MKRIVVTVGKNQFSKRQIKSLEFLILQNYRNCISSEQIRVVWNQVPFKNIYHDNENGQPTILLIECKPDLEQECRLEMFQSCTSDWLSITGQRVDQLIISILDSTTFNALLERNSQQLTKWGKIAYYLRLRLQILSSPLLKGYSTFYS